MAARTNDNKAPRKTDKAEPKSAAKEHALSAVSAFLPDFRDLIDNAGEGILIHRNFKPLYANDALATIFGFEAKEDVLALPLIRPLIPEEQWPQTEESYNALMHDQRKPEPTWVRAIRADGSELWLSLIERVVDWDGKKAVQWCLYDISRRVAIEQSLLESEQSLRAMLQILPTPVMIERRGDGQVLFVNRKTCLLFQQSASPLLKRKVPEFYVDVEEWRQMRLFLDQTSEIHEMEIRLKTASGRELIAELAAIGIMYSGEAAVLTALNDISQRKQLEAELFHQASTDPLTGLSNRRYFLTQAEADYRRARRYHRKMGLLMCDLDHFKKVNDTYGHAAGDIVLQEVSKAALSSLRESDIMGRLGGEEFAILLPETDEASALEVAERVRQSVAKSVIPIGKKEISCTLSIGVALLQDDDTLFDTLLNRADDAMYKAKKSGRNKIVSAV